MPSYKESIEQLMGTLRIFSSDGRHCEHEVRDFLLYYIPRTTIARLVDLAEEIAQWARDGFLERDGQRVPYNEKHLKAAIQALHMTNRFQPPGRATTGYLRTTLLRMWEREQGSGVATAPQRHRAEKNDTPKAKWDRMLAQLRQRINERSYNTWIRPCRLLALTETGLLVAVSNETAVYWLQQHYYEIWVDVFECVCGRTPDTIEFVVQQKEEE
jgi:hypothetical protein